jgi:crotonobetainyl-CoA:carnitine CoA-transferase CaiB-like acyl-CoA transferase
MTEDGPMPLEGVRVIDVATIIAGPGVAAHLGDFGADVIKVEHPRTGDTARNLGLKAEGVALWWKLIGRNKRPVTLNLSHPKGRDLLLRLVETADVLVESFRPGTLERWGLGPDALLERNPRLILLRTSGFGQTGPSAPRPGFGTLAEALSGYVALTGFPGPGQPPILPPVALADETAALLGAYAVMVALYHRDVRGGTGQVIDLSLFESLFRFTGPMATAYDKLGVVQERMGNRMSYAAPRGAYPTSDGRWVALSGTSQSVAERVFAAIGRPEMAEDPRFATNEARVEHVEALDAAIAEWTSARTLDEALAGFEAHQAAAAPILDAAGILDDPQYRARGTLVRVDDEELGDVLLPDVQPRLSATPGRIRHAGRPKGAANDEVYREELGLSDEELEGLAGDGVI